VIDPQNPDTLYAAAYQRRRTAFGFNGGGPGSGIFKTGDGGKTWKRLSNGLPAGDTGRIGLAIYRKNPKIVIATVENASGGVYRSEDNGETWTRTSSVNPRPMYYSKIQIDPNDDRVIWMLGVQMHFSTDGGKTFVTSRVSRIHVDNHAIWINPEDSNHILLGCDGGIQVSYDRGLTWDFLNTIPLAQFYEIHYDMRKPYWVYGGLQDNGSWGAPSSTLNQRGPTNDEWIKIGGGDGFYVQVDPMDHNTIYSESQNGAIGRMNLATGERRSIRPRPDPGDLPYRFDWNSPILISPHNPQKLLFGGNRLFISYDRGNTWRKTQDLTTSPDRSKMPIMGVIPNRQTLSLHDGQSSFGQIVTVSESPRRQGVIYVGTDDGVLQVSRDDGKTWKNLSERVTGVPRGTYVSRVVASHHQEGRVYAAFDGHRSDDFKPYVLVSEDFGETWRPISGNLPDGGTVSVIREHFRNPNLLFVGTERGLWVSFDRGGKWYPFGAPLPTVPVDDIQIHPRDNDLILGTHGRGVWILDDITPLEQAAEKLASARLALFTPVDEVNFRLFDHKGTVGHKLFIASNAPTGVLIQYYLKALPADTEVVRVTILDQDGKNRVAAVRNVTRRVGMNRVQWDMRHNQLDSDRDEDEPRAFRATRGPRVLPGSYTVRLSIGKESVTEKVRVDEDPRLKMTPSQFKAVYDQLMRLNRLQSMIQPVTENYTNLRSQVSSLRSSEDFKQVAKDIQDSVNRFWERLTAVGAVLTPPRPTGSSAPSVGSEEGQPSATPARTFSTRISALTFALDSLTEPVPMSTRQEVDAIQKEMTQIIKSLNRFNQHEVPELNRMLEKAKLKAIKPGDKLPDNR
jgi:photosystem II stability/assembly factor-like uncharacterized protein